MSEEIWKDVPDFEGLYQVSNLGRVKSCERQDSIGRPIKERILKGGATKDGYFSVSLCVRGKCKTFYVHNLVAMAFLGHKPKGHDKVINHINENRKDNRLENLEVVTSRENLEHSYGSFSSKHRGISWNKQCKKWTAKYYCPIVKKQHYIGTFNTEEQAYFGRESWISDYREYRERIESSWF